MAMPHDIWPAALGWLQPLPIGMAVFLMRNTLTSSDVATAASPDSGAWSTAADPLTRRYRTFKVNDIKQRGRADSGRSRDHKESRRPTLERGRTECSHDQMVAGLGPTETTSADLC